MALLLGYVTAFYCHSIYGWFNGYHMSFDFGTTAIFCDSACQTFDRAQYNMHRRICAVHESKYSKHTCVLVADILNIYCNIAN